MSVMQESGAFIMREKVGQGLRGMRKVVPLHSQSREGYAPEVLRQRSG